MREHFKYIKNITWDASKKRRIIKFTLLGILVLFIVIGAIVSSFQFKQHQEQLKNPTTAAQTEQKSLIEKASKLSDLPKDEKPTIATVSDVTELKDQEFFANAKEGHNVLIYQKSKRQILYDPINNKILNDGPLTINQKQN
jgi:hypothetical protein